MVFALKMMLMILEIKKFCGRRNELELLECSATCYPNN
jgi:hypothetical protein